MSFARRSLCSLAAALLGALPAGCGRGDEAERNATVPEQNQRAEVYWKERLSIPPELPPLEPTAAQETALVEISAALTDAPVLAIEPQLDRLRQMGGVAVPALVRLLAGDGSVATRRNAVLGLTATGDARAAGPLCSVLRDQSAEIALLAAHGLGELRVVWTVPRLIKVIGRYDVTPHLSVRVGAAAALLRLENYAGVPFLIKVLKEHTALEDNDDREWAQRSRIAFEKEDAIRALATIIGEDLGFSPNAPYRRQEEIIRRIESWWDEHRVALWSESPELSDPALLERIDWLVEGLTIYQIRTVDNARYILKGLGPKLFPVLAGRLTDPRVYVRVHLLEVIEQIGDLLEPQATAVEERLGPLLTAGEAPVRAQAARALGSLGDASCGPLLVPLLDDADPSVRVATVQSLGHLPGEAARAALLEIVAGMVHDEAWASAAAALVAAGHDEYLEALLADLLVDELAAQARAAEALGQLGAPIADFPLGSPREQRVPAVELIRKALATR